MTNTTPTTRAEARELEELEPVSFEGDLVFESSQFLPLPVRRVLYVLALAGFVTAPVLAVTSPDYAAAIVTGAGVLGSAALGTALANPSR
jgi:hypothetical protein